MKRYGVLLLSALLTVSLAACGTPAAAGSSQDSEPYGSLQTDSSEGASSDSGQTEKTRTLYEEMIGQIENGNYYTATQTYRAGGSALANYQDAADYNLYARALFYYHLDHKSSCLGQPYLLLSQLPSDFLSTGQVMTEIQALTAPYDGVYTMSQNGVNYRISIQNGLLSSEILTASSSDLANYQSQLISVGQGENAAMYSASLNYAGLSDLNYHLLLQEDGQQLVVESTEDSSYEVFVGTYAKISDTPLDSRK